MTDFTEYDSGSDSDFPKDEEEFEEEGPLRDLASCIAALPSQRFESSFGGPADFLPSMPGLAIEGVGRVFLPIVDKDKAASIIRVCEPVPRASGSDRCLDDASYNAFQLDPAKAKMENPEWPKAIEKAGKHITKHLGVDAAAVDLHLHKLVLFQPGGHLDKDRDARVHERAFATMVVQLPSEHEGGELVVYQGDECAAVTHDFGKQAGSAAYKCHYAVHFADADYKVTPVTRGYLLLLVYSVHWSEANKTPAPSAGLDVDRKDELCAIMEELALNRRRFYYFLEHAYTEKDIRARGAAALKHQDRNRLALLQLISAACEPENQYDFFLAKVERNRVYWVRRGTSFKHVDWEDVQGADVLAVRVHALSGSVTTSTGDVELHDDDILNPDGKTLAELWHGHRKIEYEGEPGYEDDEGLSKITTYEKYVLLAVPGGKEAQGQASERPAKKVRVD